MFAFSQRTATAVAFAAALIGSAPRAGAQAIDAFNPSPNGSVRAIALQPDGKIWIGGLFTSVGAQARARIARLHTDGAVDTAVAVGADAEVKALAVQPDGKVLVGGLFNTLVGSNGSFPRRGIGRINPDGSIDGAFDPGLNSGPTAVFAFAIQGDGRILVGGWFAALGGGGTTPRLNIGRLNADGTLDASFNPGALGIVATMALQPNGQIVIGGSFSSVGGATGLGTLRNFIARLNADGSVDLSFDPGANGGVLAVLLQPDDKIVVAGDFTMLGGGGTGTSARVGIGRLLPNGSIDAGFSGSSGLAPVTSVVLLGDGRIVIGSATTTFHQLTRILPNGNSDSTFGALPMVPPAPVRALAVQADGAVIFGGEFSFFLSPAESRANLARVASTPLPSHALTVTGGTDVTWTTSGGAPEPSSAEFSASSDGIVYSPLSGTVTRIPTGWQLTGASVTPGVTTRIRARGFYSTGSGNGSVSIMDVLAPISGSTVIENGGFDGNSAAGWLTFAAPDASGITSVVTGDEFRFYRTGTQAAVMQPTGMPFHAGAPFVARVDLGNADTVRKRISLILHEANFSDFRVCTFWLPPGQAPLTYTMRAQTTTAWSNATLSIYAASANSAGNTTGFYRIDNASLHYDPAGSLVDTLCEDPNAPTPPSGTVTGNVVGNGGFSFDMVGWLTFGQIQWQLSAGVFHFTRLAGSPAGVLLQATAQPQTANQILTATLQLGNSSRVRKRVTVLLHDYDFSDLAVCTFWLPPALPLTAYRMKTATTETWTNSTISIYPATTDAQLSMRLDNVTLSGTPAVATVGTECHEGP